MVTGNSGELIKVKLTAGEYAFDKIWQVLLDRFDKQFAFRGIRLAINAPIGAHRFHHLYRIRTRST